jgi:transcriptional regulator with XRE-family HTH domain
MNTKEFAARLRAAMKETGVTQKMLAEDTGIDKTNISHLVNGDRAPSMGTLSRLLVALPEVNARWLITGKGE